MKKAAIIIVLLVALLECAFYSGEPSALSPEKEITDHLIVQVDSLSTLIANQFLPEAENRGANPEKLKQLFLQSRLAYKKFEWAAEYFNPAITRTVNGPPVPESQPTGLVQLPGGLQVIETYLYPQYDAGKRSLMVYKLKNILADCDLYKSYYRRAAISNAQVWDAAKQEAVRVLTLNIAGFDAPLAKSGLIESAFSLNSMNKVLAAYNTTSPNNDLKAAFSKAIAFLQTDTSFDNFNRATFILSCGNPLTTAINRARHALNIPEVKARRLLRQDAATIFDADAFDASAFTAYPDEVPSAEKIALGKKLFYDPALSGSGTRSCASCHKPELAFTDGLAKNKSFDGHELLPRNTPTLLNSAFQPAQFADMREATLEGQARDVIENAKEMSGSLGNLSGALAKKADYATLFAIAFPNNKSGSIDKKEITIAIAAYVQTLSALNSRFDDYMRGNLSAMNAEEVNGFNLFMGKAKCGTCHYMPLFNGALPPLYTKMDAEVLGVPTVPNGTQIDADPGRNAITHATVDNHAFKVPTVRNAALTAPYMHNGAFNTLEQVIEFYDLGGGVGTGLKLPNQTLSEKPLHLTSTEKTQLIAFIKCLNNKPVN